jgi:glycosyltransferase involved in cell wall biosynthesis
MVRPEVSVIIPVYNRSMHLRQAIDSVFSQTFTGWELVIADDGSDDPATLGILAGLSDPRVTVVRLPHTGSPAAARNEAIRAAKGEYLAFLDSDDLWLPDKLSLQVSALSDRPECGWSYSAVSRIDDSGKDVGREGTQNWIPYEEHMVPRLLRIDALVATPSVMMRRQLAEALGGFDEELKYGEDYDLWTRAAERTCVVLVDKPLAKVRVHSGNYSSDRLGVHRNWVQQYDKHARELADGRNRRIARGRKALSALTVAAILTGRPDGRGEANRLFRRYGAALLTQPRHWRRLAPSIAKLLLNQLRRPSRPG